MSVFMTTFPAGPMGVTIKPCKLYLPNEISYTKMIVLQVTDVLNCNNPAVNAGDLIGTINGSPFVAREGAKSFSVFYETALNWLRQNTTKAKSVKMFRSQEVRITDGTMRTPIILSSRDTDVWMGNPQATVPIAVTPPPPPPPPSYQEAIQSTGSSTGAQWYQIPFPAGQPLGLGLEPLKIMLSSGMQMCVLQVISTSNPDIHQGDIVGMVNGMALAGAAGAPFREYFNKAVDTLRTAADPKQVGFFRFAPGTEVALTNGQETQQPCPFSPQDSAMFLGCNVSDLPVPAQSLPIAAPVAGSIIVVAQPIVVNNQLVRLPQKQTIDSTGIEFRDPSIKARSRNHDYYSWYGYGWGVGLLGTSFLGGGLIVAEVGVLGMMDGMIEEPMGMMDGVIDYGGGGGDYGGDGGGYGGDAGGSEGFYDSGSYSGDGDGGSYSSDSGGGGDMGGDGGGW